VIQVTHSPGGVFTWWRTWCSPGEHLVAPGSTWIGPCSGMGRTMIAAHRAADEPDFLGSAQLGMKGIRSRTRTGSRPPGQHHVTRSSRDTGGRDNDMGGARSGDLGSPDSGALRGLLARGSHLPR